MQKNQLIDLQEFLEFFCTLLPVLCFNSAKNGSNLITSHLIPILINGQDFEPVVIKEAYSKVFF